MLTRTPIYEIMSLLNQEHFLIRNVRENTIMAKPANYTDEMTTAIVAAYTAVSTGTEAERNDCVSDLAATYGKSVRSIRAKLSRENVYVAMKPVSKVTGDAPAKKEVLAAELASVTGLALVSAEKLNKTDLVALIAFAKATTETEEDETES